MLSRRAFYYAFRRTFHIHRIKLEPAVQIKSTYLLMD